jgi:phosphoribosylanthranilate isomerase
VTRVLRSGGAYRVLLDSPRGGGSGTEFDETLLRGLNLAAVVVAGGLTPATVAERVRRLRPYGVDVSSGVESAPGKKDATRVREFVRNAKSAG